MHIDMDLVIIASTAIILTAMGMIYSLVRKRVERQQLRAPGLEEIAARLERLEAGVDATAVEVERISEMQRFTTRLLSERAERDAVGIPRAGS
jgi:LDH2 family malate/lactate/ureidoglycolate dehydrogenase